jgi:hypothetical protein
MLIETISVDMHPNRGNPDTTNSDRNLSPDEMTFDEWRALQKATDKKRANIIADIVGHPKGTPSVEELDYMNPSLSDDSIRRHLSALKNVDVVEVITIDPGDRLRDYPYKFYRLTDNARELFDKNNLFPVDPWQRQYQRVEKNSRIHELEQMPRPTA